MTLTIREITRMPHLRSRVVAGGDGDARAVGWAAVCELPDPTEWLGDGDLLMTTGLSVPADAGEQRRWIELLDDAGLSGMALCESGSAAGQGMNSPALTTELLAAADERRFPIVLVEHQVPFVALAHAVANASQRAEHDRLTQVMRLYDCLRSTHIATPRGPGMLAAVGEVCRCRLYLADRATLRPTFSGWPALPPTIAASLAAILDEREEPLAAWVRFDAAHTAGIALLLPGQSLDVLVAVAVDHPLDPLLLQHAATVVGIEVELALADLEQSRRLGGDLLRHLIEGRIGLETGRAMLTEHGCDADPWLMAAVTGAPGPLRERPVGIHRRLDAHGIGCLELEWGDAVYSLVSDTEAGRAALAELAPQLGAVGVSGPFTDLGAVTVAVREARWALGAAIDSAAALADYESNAEMLVAARSIAEAERLVDAVLGPVREYDATHRSDLERTLRVFLEENRSWQRGASRLHLHKQTLVYRIRQIEKLTGRSLTSTGDVASLWLALEAARRLGPAAALSE